MRLDPKWAKIVGIALSFPSTIFISAWGSMHLHDLGFITKTQAVLIFLGLVCNVLFLMVYYAIKKKN